MTMPNVGDDDLHLYMHEIIEEEFPKALREAFKTLWDKKYALRYGPFDSACDRVSRFYDLNSNTFRWLFPNQVFSASQLPSNSASSISLEDLDFVALQDVMVHLANSLKPIDGILRAVSTAAFHTPWEFSSRNTENVDERLFSAAIDQLKAIKAEHVNSKEIMNPQLLMRQLAQAREVFTAFGVNLNDSRNTIDFSAVHGLQDLISGKYMHYSALALVILYA